MNGMLYYSDKAIIEYDLIGFTPSETNPHYREGLKILMDPPDLLDEFEMSKVVQVETEQEFSLRLYNRTIDDQRRTNRSAKYTHNDAKLTQLVLDYERPENLLTRTWLFTGTNGALIAPTPLIPAVIDFDTWRYSTRSPKYTTYIYHSAPSSAHTSYAENDARMSVHLEEKTGSFFIEWWTRKAGTNDNSKLTVFSSTDFSVPIAEVYWSDYGNGLGLDFQGTHYPNSYHWASWYKYRLAFDIPGKQVSLYINDSLKATAAMFNSGTTDGISRLLSIWFKNNATSTYHDDITYPGTVAEFSDVRMAGNIINLAEATGLGLKRFWDMSMNEMEIKEDIESTDNFCLIKHGNFHKTFQGHERIFILTGDKLVGREILSISEEDAETERVVVKNIFDQYLYTSDIKRAGFARLCRMDDEEIEIEFITATEYTAEMGTIELAAAEYGDFDT